MTTNASSTISQPNYHRDAKNVGASDIPKNRILKVSGSASDGVDLATSAGDVFFGVSTEALTVGGPTRSAQVAGRYPVATGGAFSRGADLTSDDEGRVIEASAGDSIIGRAVEASTGAGLTVSVELREGLAGSGNIVMLEVTITHAELTAAATSEAIDIGAALPTGAFVHSMETDVTTLFSGGTVSAIVLDVGIEGGDVDAMVDGRDVFTGAATGPAIGNGVRPHGSFGGAQLSALFVATGDDVADLTAGSVTIRVAYSVHA